MTGMCIFLFFVNHHLVWIEDDYDFEPWYIDREQDFSIPVVLLPCLSCPAVRLCSTVTQWDVHTVVRA